MHLESHIGSFSASLYDFNGKALWEHAPQEMMKWNASGGDWRWMDFFKIFSSSLAFFFGLLCRAGFPIIRNTLVKQQSELSFFFPKRPTWHSYPRNKKEYGSKKHSCISKVQVDGESDHFPKLKPIRNVDMNWKSRHRLLIRGVYLTFLYIVEKWNICFYLNFCLFICIPATESHTGLQERVVVTSSICTCSSKDDEVCNVKTEQSLCSKTTWTDVCCCGRSVFFAFLFMVLACVGSIQTEESVSEHVSSPVSFAASNHWQKGDSSDDSTEQETDDFLCLVFLLIGHIQVSST